MFGVPQISWAATSATLSNKDVYPNFFRVVPPDSIAMEMLARGIVQLGFSKISVVYFDAAYSLGQANDFKAGANKFKDENGVPYLDVTAESLRFAVGGV